MLTIALTKTTMTVGGILATLLMGGGSLWIYKSLPSSGVASTSQRVIKQIEEGEQNTITPIATPKRYSFAILQEGREQRKRTPGENEIEVRCQLEDGTIEELCSLSDKEVTNDKKWLDYRALKGAGLNTLIPKNFISESINVYKVRVTKAFIAEWEKKQDKKLNIFKYVDDHKTQKPLITLEPKLAFKLDDTFAGKMQYVVGKVVGFAGGANGVKELETKGKSFTCALPTTTTEEYKSCDFYHLGTNNTVLPNFSGHVLRTPLTKLTKVEDKFHYLIKFDEPLPIHPRKYTNNVDTLKIKVHNGPNGTEPATTGITEIRLQYLSPTIIFDKDNKADLAVIL